MTEPQEAKPRTPLWAWLFVAGCVAIPVLALGGAFPGAIGGGGGYACYAFARDTNKTLAQRLVICVGILGLCWALFLVLLGGMAVLRARS